METTRIRPAYGVWLYLAKVIFEDWVFWIGYFALKIVSFGRFPKNRLQAQKFDFVIFLVAFMVIVGVYFILIF